MSVTVSVTGINEVLNTLNKEIEKIGGATLDGLIEAAITIQRDMEASTPKIPVDTGNLRSSQFIVTSKGMVPEGSGPTFKGEDSGKLSSGHASTLSNEKAAILGKKPAVSMGFTANYATIVHENTEATFIRPGAGAKFLEKAIKRNQRNILQIIAKKARIK